MKYDSFGQKSTFLFSWLPIIENIYIHYFWFFTVHLSFLSGTNNTYIQIKCIQIINTKAVSILSSYVIYTKQCITLVCLTRNSTNTNNNVLYSWQYLSMGLKKTIILIYRKSIFSQNLFCVVGQNNSNYIKCVIKLIL